MQITGKAAYILGCEQWSVAWSAGPKLALKMNITQKSKQSDVSFVQIAFKGWDLVLLMKYARPMAEC